MLCLHKGLHRYVLLVYKQKKQREFDEPQLLERYDDNDSDSRYLHNSIPISLLSGKYLLVQLYITCGQNFTKFWKL